MIIRKHLQEDDDDDDDCRAEEDEAESITPSSGDPQVLPGERGRLRLRAVRRHRPAGGRQPLEEGVFPGGGRPREAAAAAVALEAQGGLLPPLRDPAEGQRGGAERAGAGHRHGRSAAAPGGGGSFFRGSRHCPTYLGVEETDVGGDKGSAEAPTLICVLVRGPMMVPSDTARGGGWSSRRSLPAAR